MVGEVANQGQNLKTMSLRTEQIERNRPYRSDRPGRGKELKNSVNRKVRRRLKLNPESPPEYKKYGGYEY